MPSPSLTHALCLSAAALLGSSSAAQGKHVNIDFSSDAGSTSGIAAAACTPGTWNVVDSFPADMLLDYKNAGSSIVISTLDTIQMEDDPGASGPTGQEGNLYNDYVIIDELKTFTVSGLTAAKTYQVFVYAWDPDLDQTKVSIHDQVGFEKVGGSYPGDIKHQNAETYWVRPDAITGVTQFDIRVQPRVPGEIGAMNGIQIREWDAVGDVDPGCAGDTTSAGLVAGMNAYGTNTGGVVSVAADDFMLVSEDQISNWTYFVFSDNLSTTTLVAGNATLCMGAPLLRTDLTWADKFGRGRMCIDFDQFPGDQIQLGVPYGFQAWFRDPAGAPSFEARASRRLDVVFGP